MASSIISKIFFSSTNVWEGDTDNINLTFHIEDEDFEQIKYKFIINGVSINEFSGFITTPITINEVISKSYFTLPNNSFFIIVEDESLNQTVFNYDIITENRDTFTLERRLEYDDSPVLSSAKVVSGEGITIDNISTGKGEVLIEFPTEGKAKLQSIIIDGNIDEVENVTIEKKMSLIGENSDGKLYEYIIPISKYDTINDLEVK